MTATSHFIVLALHNEFRVREGRVIACMVNIKMRAYQCINIGRLQAQYGELLNDTLAIFYGWHARKKWHIWGGTRIYQNMFTSTRCQGGARVGYVKWGPVH